MALQTTGSLPFTGIDLGLLIIVAAIIILMGFVLSRLGRGRWLS